MKKIKILFGITGLILLTYLLHFASYIFLSDFYLGLSEGTEDKIVFGKYSFILGFIQSVIIFAGIVLSLKCIYGIIKQGFFTATSKKFMSWAGVIFLLSGIVSSTIDIIRLFNGAEEAAMIGSILMGVMLAILGLIILIVSDMAQTGFQLKSENDLTI